MESKMENPTHIFRGRTMRKIFKGSKSNIYFCFTICYKVLSFLLKCCSFCTGSRSICLWVFLTNLTKKISFVIKNYHFLRDFCTISYPIIDFSNLKRGSGGHINKKITDPNVPTTCYLDSRKYP